MEVLLSSFDRLTMERNVHISRHQKETNMDEASGAAQRENPYLYST